MPIIYLIAGAVAAVLGVYAAAVHAGADESKFTTGRDIDHD